MSDPTSSSGAPITRVLVTGATGKQGGGVVRALAKYNSSGKVRFEIVAVTRNPDSSSANELARIPHVELVKGDLDSPDELFTAASKDGPIQAVYSVQAATPAGGATAEERQGKALADSAVKAGVQHLVYSSVEFGGTEKTDVPHFESKRHVEQYVESTYPSLKFTVLRPVAFMDNFNGLDTFMGQMMATMLTKQVKKGIKLQLIATSDIGHYAALAFDNPNEYAGKKLALAGDELTGDEMAKQYEEVKGEPLPTTYTVLSTVAKTAVTEVRTMFNFFNDTGYKADIQKLRSDYPELKTFKQWLANEHKK